LRFRFDDLALSDFFAANVVECMIRPTGEKIPAEDKAIPLSGYAKFLLTKRDADFPPMLTADHIPIEFEYCGAAQSLPRFLLVKGKPRFIQLVSELKNGVGSEDALKKVYGLSHRTLIQQWAGQAR